MPGRFEAATPRSRELWDRARRIFPQGVSGQAKFFAPYPVFIAEASGATITDLDGRRYVDLLMGAGPLLLGHGHPAVVSAVRRQAELVINPMLPNVLSLEYAERLQAHMPHLERLRFVNTGSEATRSAIRAARAATGRLKIAKFEGNYHGSDDFCLVSTHTREPAGSPDRPEGVLDYAGVAPRILDEVVVLPYNDAEAAAALIDEHGDELAAVIMEPVGFSSGGGIPAEPGFARAVRDATRRHGIVLIFDEVLCSLRLGLAGAPAYLGVTPDLVTIGKAVGGGLPLAGFGGSAEIMDAVLGPDAGARKIFQSGTFTENPLSIAAGMAALGVLESENALERADSAGEALRRGLREVFRSHDVPAAVTGVGSIVQIHPGVTAARDRRDVLRGDLALTQDIMLGCVAEGVLWPPVHPALTSAAHEPAHVERVISAVDAVLGRAPRTAKEES
ncbi:aspartate aminotransferase family protein [Sphaerisporangium rufum]|uniref:aspartate aminotransferase family protein n=1 Tax=Sphaerisporangium rufum TaxID=1381558 RepID=UPI00194E1A87|nr:aminotransferase class III-fold pyridoxal phosphate-dependent enzyme [Sphaerisporangium rufum]